MTVQTGIAVPEKTTIESLTRERGDAAARLDALEQALLDKQVRATQIDMLYANLRTAFGGQVLGTVLVAITMYTAFPLMTVALWFAASVANQISRLVLLRMYNRAAPNADDAPRWGNYWLVGAVVSGVLWSSTLWLFFSPDAPQQQIVLMSLLVSVCGVAVAITSMHLPSYYAFLFTTLLPVIARYIWEGGRYDLLIAFIVTVLMIALWKVGRNFNALIERALRSRYANEVLSKRLEAQNVELSQARDRADQASRAKSQFFAAASHDLRQPLHAMGLFAAALSAKAREPDVANLVTSISSSVEALEGLFNELLDISKIDSGKVKPEITDVSVTALFDRLRMDFEPEAFDRGLSFRMPSRSAWVRSDPVLLERILRNLISNAMRYTRTGGVLVSTRLRKGKLRFEVWDTGMGIAPDDQARIFEEFVQLANAERDRRKGLGLGLSIVQRLAALLDHPVSLSSRLGRGTVFRVDVPMGRAPVVRVAAARVERSQADLGGRCILVIDDEASIVDGMSALLGSWGAEALIAGTAAEAMAQVTARDAPPDLIIADYQLRDGEIGPEVVTAVRRHFGIEIPAILVTGSATPERLEEARDLGHHLLLKPVMPAKLRTLIQFKLKEAVKA
ncbi:hybrid sensor histidine kinase/response regulator [Methyloversatilis sp. XJ19-13]|uniref:ATP-binding response regulator n=1 Tax=Methyloversatilis sp. XJ19-13 TaxID=2963430 RepID=UPI00211B7BE3|nr:hybrid sensor histidine kinase/response regulator [Methyloversatilis sp. XJ19-13]MCQ9375891.1 hybrid sensor histidine kinase/response regulator [Methyloversatilis sp. XJ19-13]